MPRALVVSHHYKICTYLGSNSPCARMLAIGISSYLNLLSLKALVTTHTLDMDMAKAASIGLSWGPPKRVNKPAATGIPNML